MKVRRNPKFVYGKEMFLIGVQASLKEITFVDS
jgi:hypothetical protein